MSTRTRLLVSASIVAGLGVVVAFLALRERAAPPPTATSVRAPTSAPVIPRADARAVLVAAPTTRDDDPRGPLRLEGQVIDAADAPVGGARVALDSVPPREVVTEADGAFAFDGLLARGYQLEASAGADHAGPARVRLEAGTEPVTLRLRAAGEVEVVVTAASTGALVEGAEVELRGTLTWRGRSDATGVARLRGVGAGWAPLVVRAAGLAPAALMVATPGTPGPPTRVAVALVAGAAIGGVVVDASGVPVAGAEVHARAATEPLPVDDPRRDGVVTDAAGRFSLPAIGAGTWRITARHAGFAPTTSAPITVDGAHPRADLRLALAPGGRVHGVVLDATGAPVAAADVQVVAVGHLAWRPRRAAFTDARGRFDVGGLAAGAVDVVAWHPRGASAIVRASVDGAALTLALDHPGAIAGVVVDGAGTPLGDAPVVLVPDGGGPEVRAAWQVRGAPATLTDQAGRFRLPGVPPGAYHVRAARPGGDPAATPGAGTAARPGDEALRLVVDADGRVRGRVALVGGGVPTAFTTALGDGPRRPWATADGAFVVEAAPGRHTLTVAGSGFVEHVVRDVEVAPGADVDLGLVEVTAGRAVGGRVVDASGAPVEGAQVAVGALLSGDGATLYLEDESLGARATRTDEGGRFQLAGFGPGALTVVAGKDGVGRAASVRLPPGPAGATLELVLEPTTGLAGRVVRAGAPLPDTIVIANPVGATAANFFVTTGPDGSFVLDALAPGAYVVHAMLGGGGSQPKDLYARRVDVVLGRRAEVELDATAGAQALVVEVVTAAGAPPPMAQVIVVAGDVTGDVLEDLRDGSRLPLDATRTLPIYLRFAAGEPAEIAGVHPGRHTACAAALTSPDADPGALPLRCASIDVAAGAPRTTARVVLPTP